MRLRTVAILIILLAPTRPGFAQQRPLVTEDPETVGSGLILLEGGFDDAVRERISSGLATTFDYELELRRDRKRCADLRPCRVSVSAGAARGLGRRLDSAARVHPRNARAAAALKTKTRAEARR